MMKNLYNIRLHELLQINNYTEVLRVPDGWLYTIYFPKVGDFPVVLFVPYHREFEEEENLNVSKPGESFPSENREIKDFDY